MTVTFFFSATASGQRPKQPDSSDFPATLPTTNEKSEQLPTTNEKSEQLPTANQIAEQRQRWKWREKDEAAAQLKSPTCVKASGLI